MEEAKKKHFLTENNETKIASVTERVSTNINNLQIINSIPAFLNVFCLKLQPSSTADKDSNDKKTNIIYMHPSGSSALLGAEGMFVVLLHTLEDMVDQPAKCTILYSKQGSVFYVGYYKDDQNLLVFAVRKEAFSCHEVCSLMDNVVQLIRFLYGSLDLAFHRKKCHRKLDKIFFSVEHLLRQNNEKFLMPFLNYIPFLPLPKIIQLRFDEILGSLGFADFSRQKSEDDLSCQQQPLDLVGSCLFCSGYLLCSHISPKTLEDIYLYLKFNQLLDFSPLKANQQIILWREIFPTEHRNKKEMPFGYAESDSRYFLQIVTLENKMLCILLRAPKWKISTITEKLPPPPFYIERLKNLLSKLESVIQKFVEKSELFAKENVSFSNPQSSFWQQFMSLLKVPPIHYPNLLYPKPLQKKNEISKDLGVFNLTIQSPDLSDTVLLQPGTHSADSNFGNLSRSFTSPFVKERIDKFLPVHNTSISQNISVTATLPNTFQTPEYSNLIPIQNLAPSYHGIVVILHLQAGQENVDKGVRINGSIRYNQSLISEFNWYVLN